ncbi:MAG: hypothetical protein IKM08_00885, partial [Clostridia bacterium]|nr:hypothetical protein [Clostridia bacterium]
MKKLIALILSLCFLLPCVAVTVAADAGYTLVLNVADDSSELTGDTVYELPIPTAPEGKVFAGWQGSLAGEQVFLPAGAEVTLTEDAALTAVFVGMQMNQKPQIRYDIEG